MSLMDRVLTKGKNKREKIAVIIGLSLVAALFIISGSMSCKKAPPETEAVSESAPAQEETTMKEGLNEITGLVKIGYGNYFYLPSAQGFDIGFPGKIGNEDASILTGKEVRVKALFSRAMHSLLVAESIDVKEGEAWNNVYAKPSEAKLEGYFDQERRQDYQTLKITNINKSEEWEGKGKGKLFGRFVSVPPAQGTNQKEKYAIIISDEKGKEVGKILIDQITNYAAYYVKKLRLFDKFWFYFDIKETVDKKVRAKTRELFHADVVFAGLY